MRVQYRHWDWIRPALLSLGWVLLRWLLAAVILAVLGAIGAGAALLYFHLIGY